MKKYILDGKVAVPTDNDDEWMKMFSNITDRVVERTETGRSTISTVFLGLDHSFDEYGEPPLLFETLVFGGPLADEMKRYSTWEEAEQGHAKMVEMVKEAEQK